MVRTRELVNKRRGPDRTGNMMWVGELGNEVLGFCSVVRGVVDVLTVNDDVV